MPETLINLTFRQFYPDKMPLPKMRFANPDLVDTSEISLVSTRRLVDTREISLVSTRSGFSSPIYGMSAPLSVFWISNSNCRHKTIVSGASAQQQYESMLELVYVCVVCLTRLSLHTSIAHCAPKSSCKFIIPNSSCRRSANTD